MSNEPVDILFIVPSAREDTYRRAIKLTLWVLESEKTFGVMPADEFVRRYKGMTGEQIDVETGKLCKSIVNARDISRREWKEFGPLWESWGDYFKNKFANKQEAASE